MQGKIVNCLQIIGIINIVVPIDIYETVERLIADDAVSLLVKGSDAEPSDDHGGSGIAARARL